MLVLKALASRAGGRGEENRSTDKPEVEGKRRREDASNTSRGVGADTSAVRGPDPASHSIHVHVREGTGTRRSSPSTTHARAGSDADTIASMSESRVWQQPCHNEEAWARFVRWLRNTSPSNQCAAVVGPVGTGKTSGVMHHAQKAGYCVACIDVMDAGEIRNLRSEMQRADLTNPVLFLVDDADGLTDEACDDLRTLMLSLAGPCATGGGRTTAGTRSHRRLVMAMADARNSSLRGARDACSASIPILQIPPTAMVQWYCKTYCDNEHGRGAKDTRVARAIAEQCAGDMRQFRLRVALTRRAYPLHAARTAAGLPDTSSVDVRANHPFAAVTAALAGMKGGYELYGKDDVYHALLRHNCVALAPDVDTQARLLDDFSTCASLTPRCGGEGCYLMWNACALPQLFTAGERATAAASRTATRISGASLTFPARSATKQRDATDAAARTSAGVGGARRADSRGDGTRRADSRGGAVDEQSILSALNATRSRRQG